jgi:hypothetical protein
MRAWFVLCTAIIACTPQTTFVLTPSEAAAVSRTYHDRVWVAAVRRGNEDMMRSVTGALVDDGLAIVTQDDRKLPVDVNGEVKLVIRYVEGDPAHGRAGIVHRGVSDERIGAGVALIIFGVLASVASVVGFMQCAPQYSFCTEGMALLIPASFALMGVGAGLTIRGIVPMNLMLKF